MFFRMVFGNLFRQWKKMIMIALTIALGASLATAMLCVMFNVADKVNQELKAYGANITVTPKAASIVSDLYDVEGGGASGAYLDEDDLGKIKTIFWAYNIVDFAPFVTSRARLADGTETNVVGSWFRHHLSLSTGEELDAGMRSLRSWWDIVDGAWIDEREAGSADRCMVGVALARKEGLKAGDRIRLEGDAGSLDLVVAGVFDAGGAEDDEVFTLVENAQILGGLQGRIDSIEVSALTTPDNELAERAAKDPGSLTASQYETWYCTAYVSSICYQIQEAIPGSVAKAVRQVADSEGAILDKTQLLMVLITILSMVGSGLGICNLVTATVMDRAQEIGLMKAIGATNGQITGLVMTEISITGLAGGLVGFFAGFGFAQIIGQSVFGSSIALTPSVIPLVVVLVILVTILGSLPAIRMLLNLSATEVLHEK